MKELYVAGSDISRLIGMPGVSIQWFVAERRSPVDPYEGNVPNYRNLGEFEQVHTRTAIDELLTRSEMKKLRKYLSRAHGMDLGAVEAPRLTGPLMAYGGYRREVVRDCALLSAEPEYDLGVPIWGYLFLGGYRSSTVTCAPGMVANPTEWQLNLGDLLGQMSFQSQAHCPTMPDDPSTSVELRRDGGSFYLHKLCWANYLAGAYSYGWQPAGTTSHEESWHGSYYGYGGQVVTGKDALAIAEGMARVVKVQPKGHRQRVGMLIDFCRLGSFALWDWQPPQTKG